MRISQIKSEHELPSSPDKPVYVDNSVDIGGMLKSNGVGTYLGKPRRRWRGWVRGQGRPRAIRVDVKYIFDKIELKVELIDKRGNEIDESTDYNSAPSFFRENSYSIIACTRLNPQD